MMTSTEYVEASGAMCPFCQSKDIEGASFETGEHVYQDITCGSCGKEWTDIYTLSSYEVMNVPPTQ